MRSFNTPGTKKSSSDTFLKTTTWGKQLALLTLMTLLAAGLCLADGKHKVSSDLDARKGGNSGATVDVIIQFNQTPTDVQHGKVQNKGGVLKTKLDFIKGAHYTVPVEALDALADDPDVAYISPDRPVQGALDNAVATVNGGYAQTLGLTGAGIGVAVVDSGISDIPDLHNASGSFEVVYAQSFVPNDPSTSDPFGHGTHVAGIIASSGASSTGLTYYRHFVGIASGVDLINLRVLDANGTSTDSVVIAAIQKAVTLQKRYRIQVMNLSLGRAVYESASLDPLCQAVESAWKAGITVVVAAGNYGRLNTYGNNGYGTITAPGNDPYVITVGAMNTMGTPSRTDDVITTYSSKGPTSYDNYIKPDLVAPGNRVVSLYQPGSALSVQLPQNPAVIDYYKSCNSTNLSGSYFTLSGTSMATPVVSGAADYRRGHAGTAKGKVGAGQIRAVARLVVVDHRRILRKLDRQCRTRLVQRNHTVSGRDEVRLDVIIVGCWPLRAVRGDHVVRAAGRAHRVHCTHGNDVGVVSRCRDRAIATVAVGVEPSVVYSRDHHGYARFPGAFHRLAKGIEGCALVHSAAKRQIHHLNAVALLEGDCLLYRRDDHAIRAHALRIQHAQIDEIYARSDTHEMPVVGRTRRARSTGS